MSDTSLQSGRESRGQRNWDGVAAIVAALIGFLALLVSGYTAYIQRQQVRAQVWPYLLIGYADFDRSIIVLNKGVGPAQIRSVQVLVDDKPQRNWEDAMKVLGVKTDNDDEKNGSDDKKNTNADQYTRSTISGNVLSAGERIELIKAPDAERYERFRLAAQKRVKISICYCSTLGECWVRDRKAREQGVAQVEVCPAWPTDQLFKD
jgi:hypothetical protein